MSIYTKLAYGTLVALTGAGSLYLVSANSGARLVDAVQERKAAVAVAWPFTTNGLHVAGWGKTNEVFEEEIEPGWVWTNHVPGYGTQTNLPDDADGWSFSGFSAIPLFGSGIPVKSMREVCGTLRDIIPSYVDGLDATGGPVMLTVTGLMARLHIGDGGTNGYFTIAGSTNGPVYGLYPGTGVSTATIAECWRIIGALTCTVRTAEWVSHTNSSWDAPYVPYLAFVGTPADWTNTPAANRNVNPLMTSYNSFSLSDVAYTAAASATAGAPYETIYVLGPNWVDDFDGYLRFTYEQRTARKRRCEGALRLPSMAAGCSVGVTVPYYTTGVLSLAGAAYGSTNRFSEAGTQTASVAFSGLSTNWGGVANCVPAKQLVTDFLGATVVGNFSRTGTWVSDHYRFYNSNIVVNASISTKFTGPALLRWTFANQPP